MKFNNEAKIGVLVVIVIVILGYLTWEAGDYDFTPEGYEMKVHLKNIDGVELNAPVTLNGFEVGRVTNIEIIYAEKTYVELTLWMDANAKLHEGALALVKQMGFLGEKYIGLTTGDDSKGFLGAGAVIMGREPGNFEEILSEGEVIAKNIREISEQLNERLKVNSEAIDSIFADMRVSMDNIKSISSNVKERLDLNKGHIDSMALHLDAAAVNLEEMSYDLKENPWKLLYKPKTLKKN